MKNIIFPAVIIGGLLVVAQSVFAVPERVPATTVSGQSVVIPAHAVQVASNVYDLGEAVDPERGDVVRGYLIVSPRNGHAKPDGTPGKSNDKNNGTSACYDFLAKDAKWKGVEPWTVNPANGDGIADTSIFSILENSVAKWEDAADGNVDGISSTDILGIGSITSDPLQVDTSSMDGQNEVYFDALGEGTIGITVVWGIFGGPPFQRELREWDQVYNTFYPWSDNGALLAMDFENIATHELGHSVGLGDLYTTECFEETMYGYGDFGETQKRDLNAGDIEGISKLY